MNETRQRFGDVATKLQAALTLKDVFIQVVSSEQSGRFTKVTAKMSPSDIKWLIENKFTISKEIGSDSIRVVESDDGVVSIEVGLPFSTGMRNLPSSAEAIKHITSEMIKERYIPCSPCR